MRTKRSLISGTVRRSILSAAIEPCEARRLMATVGYWRFEEGATGATASGATVLDSSGNGYTGSAFNGPTYSNSVPAATVPLTGASNTRSLAFNVSGRRVFVPDAAAFKITGSLTIEAYVNAATGAPAEGQILYRGDNVDGFDPYFLELSGDDLVFTISDAVGGEAILSTPFASHFNKWTHVAGVFDASSGKMTIYIDGAAAATQTTAIRPYADLPGAQPGLGIGNTQSGSVEEHFPGTIDEVRLSNAALSPSQFLRGAGTTSTPTRTISGTVYNDVAANGVRNGVDPGLANRTVYIDVNGNKKLDLATEPHVTTSSSGTYAFTASQLSDYSAVANASIPVRVLAPTGWTFTSPTSGVQVVAIGANGHVTDIDFGQTTVVAAPPIDAELADGVLTVNGTALPDRIGVGSKGSSLAVTVNSVTAVFPLAEVQRIDVLANAGNDYVTFAAGQTLPPAYLDGGDGNDVLDGTDGNDIINGAAGRDTIGGRGGNDRIAGGLGNDTISGGIGKDRINGQDGNDYIWGDGSPDILSGNGGNDTVIGGSSNDTIYGNDGDDVLNGLNGADSLDGGLGQDTTKEDPNDVARIAIEILV